jgi:hypothetical protein
MDRKYTRRYGNTPKNLQGTLKKKPINLSFLKYLSYITSKNARNVATIIFDVILVHFDVNCSVDEPL